MARSLIDVGAPQSRAPLNNDKVVQLRVHRVYGTTDYRLFTDCIETNSTNRLQSVYRPYSSKMYEQTTVCYILYRS